MEACSRPVDHSSSSDGMVGEGVFLEVQMVDQGRSHPETRHVGDHVGGGHGERVHLLEVMVKCALGWGLGEQYARERVFLGAPQQFVEAVVLPPVPSPQQKLLLGIHVVVGQAPTVPAKKLLHCGMLQTIANITIPLWMVSRELFAISLAMGCGGPYSLRSAIDITKQRWGDQLLIMKQHSNINIATLAKCRGKNTGCCNMLCHAPAVGAWCQAQMRSGILE